MQNIYHEKVLQHLLIKSDTRFNSFMPDGPYNQLG